ncbi:MAG: PMT family glycosyltransferase, 4-amino-4-deoxy-L-arabinose transferase [Parcubacteria group bacterium Gr01-1014_31]|nr:MAG: PMT family glycosyltransferase, 4-amino-4-deoxy-L-arabinose transferase [Parcubacteria group bacterium Gr01-1014_31]
MRISWFSSQQSRNTLLVILAVAAVLRFWNLGGPDMVTDEVYYALRGIGYLDYIGSDLQSTPLYWFNPLPAWTMLSMHDHPPLVFLVANLFFNLFGVSVLVARLPFALAGLGSVLLVYLIGRKMFSERAGLVAAAVMAVSSHAVFASRTALMEPMAIVLILLTWFVFLLALENPKWFPWWGAVLGLSFLAKYTAFPVLAVCVAYLALFRRDIFRLRKFHVGLFAVLAVFSPVIIYNVMLYRTTGHFDLQFAALLKQQVPEWQLLAEKIPTSYWDNFIGIFRGLVDAYSPLALGLAAIGLAYSFLSFRPRSRNPVTPPVSLSEKIGFLDSRLRGNDESANHILLLLFLVAYTLLLVLIKPLPRFLSYYLLVFPLASGAALTAAWQAKRGLEQYALLGLVALAAIYELGFSVNTNLVPFSYGAPNLAWSLVRPYTSDFGINALDRWIDKELAGKTSAGVPQTGTVPLDAAIQRNAERYGRGKQQAKVLLVYDTHLHETITLWVFDRRFIYQGFPAYYADEFSDTVEKEGAEKFKGYTIYYVTGTEYSLWRQRGTVSAAAMKLEKKLVGQGFSPTPITNSVGLPVFKAYRFGL